MSDNEKSKKKPGLFSIIQSVLAAMFGVQSDTKREQDFEQGNISDYIFAGIIAVIIFILTIIWLVNRLIDDYNAGL